MSNYRKTMADALREMYPLTEETQIDEGTIDKVKEIASKKQAMKIDGVMVDSFTASAISQIYDKVNDANKKKMEKLPITKLANLAMKMMQKNDYVPEEVDLDENLKQMKKHINDIEFDRKRMTTSGQESLDKLIKAKNINDARKAFDDMYGYEYDRVDSSSQQSMVKVGKMLGMKMEEADLDEGKIMVADPKTQKVIKIDEKDWPEYEKKGYVQAEEVDLDEGKMSQLHQYIKDKKSPEEIAKMMKLDVKTVKSLMANYISMGYSESAASDARKAISKDKDLGRGTRWKGGDDTDATDADIKGASKNIIMQLRKAGNRASRGVEFADGKKVQIPAKMALAVQQKYNSLKRPADKEKFQAQIAKSYKDMLNTLKAGYGEQKESILDRMNRKIKENKNG